MRPRPRRPSPMRNPLLKIVDVAAREYRATAMTKAFIFGTLVVPVMAWVIIALVIPLFDSPDQSLEGSIAVVDRTDAAAPVASALALHFDTDRLRAEHDRQRAEHQRVLDMDDAPPALRKASERALKRMPRSPHEVEVQRIDAGADDETVEALKSEVGRGDLLALFVIPPEANVPGGRYEIYTGRDLDFERAFELRDVVNRAIVDTRISRSGENPADVRALVANPQPDIRTITDRGETDANPAAQFIVPMAFMMLLWIAVFSSGQYLLTTTIEEKSTRVMELLLSAVSPMQLMTGKIIGQGLVGLTIMVIYGGLGVVVANQFNVMGLVPTEALPWLVLYFVMGYFLIGSFMAAIGSAVNELREAQSLMGTVMIVMMIPFFLWSLIIRQPNSTFSTVASFVPPLTPFIMILRLAQTTEPIPMWQVVATTLLGFGAVVAAVWCAAKVFRVGVLMYGKPPTPLTLIRWIRHA
ncbi:MAG: ABC transporter permease [Phycisphaerales bacterium]|nr:MAG: ABC transporter permease [Phycisphaerales bacterium]